MTTQPGQSIVEEFYVLEAVCLRPLREDLGDDCIAAQALSIWSDAQEAIDKAIELTNRLAEKLDLAYVVSVYGLDDDSGGEEVWTSHQLIPGRDDYLKRVR